MITIKLTQYVKSGMKDPEGEAIKNTLLRLEFPVADYHIGREMLITLDVDDEEEALRIGDAMADRILVNVILNDYTVSVVRDVIDEIWDETDDVL